MTRHLSWSLLALCCLLGSAWAEDDEQVQPWQESEIVLPAAPPSADLLPFEVSMISDNRHFIDARSVSVGNDGVVRYILVVQTAGGARNVSFEGMRCETRERRLYATERRDGTWSPSRNRQWVRIQNETLNRQHAALFLEYFCPGGVIVASANEAVEALRKGVHPLNQSLRK